MGDLKFLSVALAFVMLLGFVGCGGESETTGNNSASKVIVLEETSDGIEKEISGGKSAIESENGFITTAEGDIVEGLNEIAKANGYSVFSYDKDRSDDIFKRHYNADGISVTFRYFSQNMTQVSIGVSSGSAEEAGVRGFFIQALVELLCPDFYDVILDNSCIYDSEHSKKTYKVNCGNLQFFYYTAAESLTISALREKEEPTPEYAPVKPN